MHHVHFEEIDSTNNWLKSHLHLIPEGEVLWVTADAQTMGRGRHGKSWVSKAGEGLWVTYGYWGGVEDPGTPMSIEIARKLCRFFETLGLKTTVKAPNDILVNGRKLCGILCETAWQEEKLAHIVGIGINVESSPEDLDQPTTSLKAEGVNIDVPTLFKKLHTFKQQFYP